MSDEFYRMKRLPPYVIAEVNAMRAAARAGGEDIIDLGMGNPDLPPPDHVIEKLIEVAKKPDAHGYSASKGIPGLRRAQANYYGRRFGVEVDPETEVVATLGSKMRLIALTAGSRGGAGQIARDVGAAPWQVERAQNEARRFTATSRRAGCAGRAGAGSRRRRG